MNWTGVEGSTEHRTVGEHRAWCYQDNEWCYPQRPTSPMSPGSCDCCMEAAGYEKTWVRRQPEEQTTPPEPRSPR